MNQQKLLSLFLYVVFSIFYCSNPTEDTTIPKEIKEITEINAYEVNTYALITWTDPTDSTLKEIEITYTGGSATIAKGIQRAEISGLMANGTDTFTLTAKNDNGEDISSSNITEVVPTNTVDLASSSTVSTLVHDVSPPSGYVLGVRLPDNADDRTGVATGSTNHKSTLRYHSSNINRLLLDCEDNDNDYMYIVNHNMRILAMNLNLIDTVTIGTSGSRSSYEIILGDGGITGNIQAGSSFQCFVGDQDTSPITISSQYFPSADQTNPPGNGYRFPTTITSGNEDSTFSFDDILGRVILNQNLNSSINLHVLVLSDGTTLGIEITP